MRTTTAVLILLFAVPLAASTTANDDSCDIAQQPAATLLLPYFEVDLASTNLTTIFSVTNVTPQPQIANVTIWTDWGYPVANLPIVLTGYDVQPINLYDLLVRGIFGAPGGTSSSTPVPLSPTLGSQPAANTANPHFLANAGSACGQLPGTLPASVLADLQSILTTGKTGNPLTNACAATQVGAAHPHAIGYITIDVVATCAAKTPASPDYYGSTLLFDNVFTGDYQIVSTATGHQYALGGPMVHIRAIPEGGAAGSLLATPLPYTFYDRLTQAAATRSADRRQPLPSTFAARWIQGGPGGFSTSYRIWREAVTGGNATCADYASNAHIPTADFVRFDEHENATIESCALLSGCIGSPFPSLPATSTIADMPSTLPPFTTATTDAGGWLYFNLNDGSSPSYGGARHSQNWVIVSMFAQPTYAVESSATAMGNGCSPPAGSGGQIQPAP